jgi:DNA-binding response OmpR family regulator
MDEKDREIGTQGHSASAILLIDDNAVQAATRQTILKRAGYYVIAVLSPQRALEQVRSREFPAEIELVITDHLMPGMTGTEFVRELRKIEPDLPVLVISGLEEAEDEYAGLDVDFRMKPLLPDHLLASVHRLMTRANSSTSTPLQNPAS